MAPVINHLLFILRKAEMDSSHLRRRMSVTPIFFLRGTQKRFYNLHGIQFVSMKGKGTGRSLILERGVIMVKI